MEIQDRTDLQNRQKKTYRLKNRLFSVSGALEWPPFFTIVRRATPKPQSVQELTQVALLNVYAPVAVLVDQLANIHYVHGHTGLFLEPAQGAVRVNNVLKMARKKIRRDLNKTLYQAVTTGLTSNSAVISVRHNGDTVGLVIRVMPFLKTTSKAQKQDFYLIIFEQHLNQQAARIPDDRITNSEAVTTASLQSDFDQQIESKEIELAGVKIALEKTRQELENFNNQLDRVTTDLSGAEIELLKHQDRITAAEIELQVLNDQIAAARTVLADSFQATETITPEPFPAVEEEDNIISELLLANQTLAENNEALEKLAAYQIPLESDQELYANPADVAETELLFSDVSAFQAAASHGYRHDQEIKTVIIPEGVEVIKRSMFYKCSQLTTISFPGTLKAIEDFAFYGCEALKKMNLDRCKVLEVIGTSAFEGCLALTDLVIPDAVIEIEEAAFLGCQAIEMVEFSDNSQLESLGSHVFKDCHQISRLVLPDQLKHIGISCFYGCHNLTEIQLPRELETVGEYAFFGCRSLTKIDVANKKILKQPGFSVGLPDGIKL